MPDEEILSIPVEVPWRLAATTQRLKTGEAEETTLSLFYFEPQMAELAASYPNERLVYIKLTASVSPCRTSDMVNDKVVTYLSGGLPVRHLLIDMGVTPNPFQEGGIRPYFHAAAPLRRSMLETGVFGYEVYEGEANGLSVGKSASTLHESLSSQISSKMNSVRGGLPGFITGSRVNTSTETDSERSVEQYLETTNRDASVERRELLSHTTDLRNILTLLTAKHVGSPFLRFSLWPRPVADIAMDPSDPELWYRQLLRYRSSGIEGIQEFFAVVVVPRTQRFCIQVMMRRVCVLANPPTKPDYTFRDDKISSYLNRLYPRGTPLELLDVDMIHQIDERYKSSSSKKRKDMKNRPAVYLWTAKFDEVVHVLFQSPRVSDVAYEYGDVNYKTFYEVARDAENADYLEALARSPLETGLVVVNGDQLSTCFEAPATGGLGSITFAPGKDPPTPIPWAADFKATRPFEPVPSTRRGFSDIASKWEDLDNQLHLLIRNVDQWPREPLQMDDLRLLSLVLERWESLRKDDPRNMPLSKAAGLFRLTSAQLELLQGARISDLQGLASAIRAAPEIAERNRHIREALARGRGPRMEEVLNRALSNDCAAETSISSKEGRLQVCVSVPETPFLLEPLLSPEQALELQRTIAASLKQESGKSRAGPVP
jgi:hypothetical protein